MCGNARCPKTKFLIISRKISQIIYQLGTSSPLPSGEKEVSQTPHYQHWTLCGLTHPLQVWQVGAKSRPLRSERYNVCTVETILDNSFTEPVFCGLSGFPFGCEGRRLAYFWHWHSKPFSLSLSLSLPTAKITTQPPGKIGRHTPAAEGLKRQREDWLCSSSSGSGHSHLGWAGFPDFGCLGVCRPYLECLSELFSSIRSPL